ncbi:UNVERIFIED_CONTAM: hypothetical protein Sangu_1769200 [Sesamum angustifolium]|uniref:Retrotransposon gag domain-containing protein n=1 Tax=Sesamum angustifolium TaxID=2727405 RepID=A0AAW2M5Y0_9LAMI
MPRSSRTGELTFDPEIEKTARRLRWETKQHTEEASTSYEDGKDITLEFEESSGESEEVMAIVPERTINDMTSPDLNQQPLCIEYPDLEVNFELKSGLIHLLPTFRGLAGEDPHKHLKEFMWFAPRRFLEKYFPASRATTIRKEISGIRQFAGESLFEYWGRFNELVKSCPHHQIPDHLLIQYFYEGLSSMDRKLIDAASGGALFNKTPTEARNLISIMASNTQQFGTRYDDPPRRSNEQQRRYDPFSNTYNPGWKDHPNLSYGAQSQNFRGLNTDHLCRHRLILSKNLESQMSQLASSVSKLESQVEKNCKKNRDENSTKRGHAQQRKPEKEVEIPQEQDDETKEDNPKVLITKPPFPERFAKSKRMRKQKRSLKLFASKGKLKGNERVSMGENVSAILQRKLPPKCKDPETGVVIQLADRSVVYPEGVLEDVLVQVNELVFPADFYVLDMREDNSPSSTSILLGRPFLKTARTKIDVHAGTLSMEFDGEIIKFNIFDSMRYPSDIPTVLFVDAFDPFVQKFPAIDDKDYIKLALEESPMPMEEENMGVDPLVQVNAKFDGDSAFLAKINKDLTYGPRTYKNKAFHDKISSRKNSLMNIKVFIGPRHLRKYYMKKWTQNAQLIQVEAQQRLAKDVKERR